MDGGWERAVPIGQMRTKSTSQRKESECVKDILRLFRYGEQNKEKKTFYTPRLKLQNSGKSEGFGLGRGR